MDAEEGRPPSHVQCVAHPYPLKIWSNRQSGLVPEKPPAPATSSLLASGISYFLSLYSPPWSAPGPSFEKQRPIWTEGLAQVSPFAYNLIYLVQTRSEVEKRQCN